MDTLQNAKIYKRKSGRMLKLEEADDMDDDEEVKEDDVDAQEEDIIKPKRGRKAIPDRWSRVISLSSDDLSDLKVYELAPDLLMSGAMKQTVSRGKEV